MIKILEKYPEIYQRCIEIEDIIKEAELTGLPKVNSNDKIMSFIPVKDGKKDGSAYIWFKNGQIECSWSYVNDKRDGEFTIFYENGNKLYKSFYKQGVECGIVTVWDTGSKTTPQSHITCFVKCGIEDYFNKNFQDDDEIKEELSYFNSVFNNEFKKPDMETNDTLNSFDDIGVYYITKANSNPCKLETYPNGDKSMCYQHKNNIMDGLYEGWYRNGQMKVRAIYKDGKLDGLFESFHSNGQIERRSNYKDGKLDGLYERWHDNGQMEDRQPFKDGKRDGLHESWYSNGKLDQVETFKDDNLEGSCKWWHYNGQLMLREHYLC